MRLKGELSVSKQLELWSCDFETTTNPADCRVWAWGAARVDDPSVFTYGTDIATFLAWLDSIEDARVWFHNAKFDMEFVFCQLLRDGWEWVESKEHLSSETFTTLISDMGKFYSATLMFDHGHMVEVRDSLKVIPIGVERIPKAFGLSEDAKLQIDYDEDRPVGHVLTEEEVAYLREDVVIVAKALAILIAEGNTRLTAGSNALHALKKSIGGERGFSRRFSATGLRRGGSQGVPGRLHVGQPALSGAHVGSGHRARRELALPFYNGGRPRRASSLRGPEALFGPTARVIALPAVGRARDARLHAQARPHPVHSGQGGHVFG